MTKNLSVKTTWFFLFLISALNLLVFQNCSNSTFNSENTTTTCTDSGTGSLSCIKTTKTDSSFLASSTPNNTSIPLPSTTKNPTTPNTPPTTVPTPTPFPSPTTPTTPPTTPSLPSPVVVSPIVESPISSASLPVIISGSGKFNFVAGDRVLCEKSIQTRLGISASCAIGAGCGLSCGAPNGTTCLSANPTLPGSCIDLSYGSNTVGGSITKMFNFINSDKALCERSIGKQLGLNAICVIGGGCSSSCGIPNGSTCISDNPGLFGACIKAFIKLNN